MTLIRGTPGSRWGEAVVDGFFEPDITDRSPADEIAEAVLIAAQREHEEQKLPYIANLLAFVAFESRIDRGMANYLIKLASFLTYRQLCILELARNPFGRGLHPAPFNTRQQENPSQVFAALSECSELYRVTLIRFPARQSSLR